MALPRSCARCGGIHQSGERCGGTTAGRGYGWSWQQLSRQVIEEEGRCRDCGHTGSPDNPLTADHIVPKIRGGTDDPRNLCARCRRCNSRKSTRVAVLIGGNP